MSDKILVAYATKAGSTAEAVEAVGEELRNMGAEVDVRLAKDVKDLKQYSAVILGTGIRMGKWVPEATKFVETNREALSQVPVAFFVVCLTMKEDTEENRRTVEAYLDPVCEVAKPLGKGLFAGVIDYSKLSFSARMMTKAMKISEGDFRDWETIRAWAQQAYDSLRQE